MLEFNLKVAVCASGNCNHVNCIQDALAPSSNHRLPESVEVGTWVNTHIMVPRVGKWSFGQDPLSTFVGLPQQLFPKCILNAFLLFLARIYLGLCALSPWKTTVTSYGKLRNGSRVPQTARLSETLTILRASLPPSEDPGQPSPEAFQMSPHDPQWVPRNTSPPNAKKFMVKHWGKLYGVKLRASLCCVDIAGLSEATIKIFNFV